VLASVLPPGWDVEDEALVILPDHDKPLPRLRFSHSVLPDGYSIILGQGYAENSLCYSFHLVHLDVAAVAQWIKERRGSDDDDDEDDEPYVVSSKDFSELGIDEEQLIKALGVLEPWLEAADDFVVCPFPDLDGIENVDQLPELSHSFLIFLVRVRTFKRFEFMVKNSSINSSALLTDFNKISPFR